MVTEAGNAEERGSELCESVNRCRDREKKGSETTGQFDCGESERKGL